MPLKHKPAVISSDKSLETSAINLAVRLLSLNLNDRPDITSVKNDAFVKPVF